METYPAAKNHALKVFSAGYACYFDELKQKKEAAYLILSGWQLL